MTAELVIEQATPSTKVLVWKASAFAQQLRCSVHSIRRLAAAGHIRHIVLFGQILPTESPEAFLDRVMREHAGKDILPPPRPEGEPKRIGRPPGARDSYPRKRRAPAQLPVAEK